MKIDKQLGKIESHLNAFAMTEEVEHLQAAQYLIADLVSEMRRLETVKFVKKWKTITDYLDKQ